MVTGRKARIAGWSATGAGGASTVAAIARPSSPMPRGMVDWYSRSSASVGGSTHGGESENLGDGLHFVVERVAVALCERRDEALVHDEARVDERRMHPELRVGIVGSVDTGVHGTRMG